MSGGNEKSVTGNGGKGNPYYKVAQNLAELRSSVLWKVDFLNAEILHQERSLVVVEKVVQRACQNADWD